MKIELPVSLNAELTEWDDEYIKTHYYHVIVKFGDTEVIRLITDEPVRNFSDEEWDQRTLEQTVAHWLKEKLA